MVRRDFASPDPFSACLSTKISIAVDALGNPVRFILTAGQVSDICQAEGLISGFSFENLLADAGAEAVIPPKRSRSGAIPYDKDLYKERNLVERFINKIKHYRCFATRYDKTVVSFAACAIPGRSHDLAEVNVHMT